MGRGMPACGGGVPVRGRVHVREDGYGLWGLSGISPFWVSGGRRPGPGASISPPPPGGLAGAANCPRGAWCTPQEFFAANKKTLSKDHLATALRAIIMDGPAKTRRTPMLVGPSNTGKSTLVAPFVKLFGFRSVFHKPAGTSAPRDRARVRGCPIPVVSGVGVVGDGAPLRGSDDVPAGHQASGVDRRQRSPGCVRSAARPQPNCVGSAGAAEAMKSAFALRNILKDKRFLYWDDYRPVQYAQGTVEVGTVLSLFNGLPFEVQMPQNVHDGTLGAASQATSDCLPWRPAGLLRPKL